MSLLHMLQHNTYTNTHTCEFSHHSWFAATFVFNQFVKKSKTLELSTHRENNSSIPLITSHICVSLSVIRFQIVLEVAHH